MQLSKTDFLHYQACSKSLWLLKHKPKIYPHKSHSNYDAKLAQEGYQVQKNVTNFLLRKNSGREYVFNQKFKTADGLFAEADIDGALVGGASLISEDFVAICRATGTN